jgi:hypothetical protein
MKEIGEHLKVHVQDVLTEWERLVREQPWYSLPPDRRIDNLPEVIASLVNASLCTPANAAACRQVVEAAAVHGYHRREQGIPEHLILTEYHLLRQALWYYLVREFGGADSVNHAIMRLDSGITLTKNASMWGYHRPEIESMGRWDEGIERMSADSPLHPRR